MKKIILLLTAIFLFNFSYSQNEKLKSLFIYNFAKYIKWSKKNSKGDFVIGVYNGNKMFETMKKIMKNKKSGSRKIVINNYKNISSIKNCNILYIPYKKSSLISKIASSLKRKATVIVSDSKSGISKGAGINFVIKSKKIRFEIRKRNVEKNGIKVNSNLIKLGIKK